MKTRARVFELRHRVFELHHRVFELRHRVFELRHRVFELRRRVFELRRRVFELRHRVFKLRTLVPRLQPGNAILEVLPLVNLGSGASKTCIPCQRQGTSHANLGNNLNNRTYLHPLIQFIHIFVL
jgi:hypothetical protein